MSYLNEAFSLYLSRFHHILFITLVIGLPLQFGEYFLTVFVFVFFDYLGLTLIGTIGMFIVAGVGVILIQIPYIWIASHSIINEEVDLRYALLLFIKCFVPIGFLSTLYLTGVLPGTLLLIVPGIIFLTFAIFYPYVKIIDNLKGKKAIKKMFEISKNHCIQMILILIVFISANMLIWFGLSWTTMQFTTDLITFIILRMLLNVFMVPLFVFVMTLHYYEWSPQSFTRLET
ncbi:hypothetical protein [Salipaludibacillus daqingensis]|uniref:hypothetical protein n=1 Tax=Salipaludibacillus daqingensis TaxID=3041001 RepID=UPI002476867D|nr:hypothetical protein [Salipaludibacillus daqingensis]